MLVHKDKCKIFHTKPIKIKQYQSSSSLELFSKKISWMLGSHQGLIDFAQINSINSIIWNYKIFIFMLISKYEKLKIYLKSRKKMCKMIAGEKMATKFIEIRKLF